MNEVNLIYSPNNNNIKLSNPSYTLFLFIYLIYIPLTIPSLV